MRGRSFGSGRTPFEVLLFERREDYDFMECEADFKRHLVAKFSTYGDSILFAQACTQRPCVELIGQHLS